MALKADPGTAWPVAMSAGKCMFGVWRCGCSLFPFFAFVLDGVSSHGLKRSGSFVDRLTPYFAVLGKVRPLFYADVTNVQGLFESVFVPLFGGSSVSVTGRKFSEQGYFREAVVFHPGHVPGPS